MATVRTRNTPEGPSYDVRDRANGKQWSRTFRTLEDARAYRKRVEGEELAGLVTDPTGGERLFSNDA